MFDIEIIQHPDNKELVVDSRLIAEALNLDHTFWYRDTIKPCAERLDGRLGLFEFQTHKLKGRGRPQKFVLLSERQAMHVVNLARRTPEVEEFQLHLNEEFFRMRDLLKKQQQKTQTELVYIQRYKHNTDIKLEPGYWCVFKESLNILNFVESNLKLPVQKFDLCDGSIGIHWSKYRKDKEWAGEVKPYVHKFPDQRKVCKANSFPMSEIGYFYSWLYETYQKIHLVKYLFSKYDSQLVLQAYQQSNCMSEYVRELGGQKERVRLPRQRSQRTLSPNSTTIQIVD